MGSYATTTSIAVLLPNFLKADTTTVDENGTAIFSNHITRSESLVNSVVATRYELPISPVPPILRTLSEDIACYYAMRGTLNQDGKNKNQYLVDFESAMKILGMIGAGDMALTYTDGSQVAAASTARFMSSTRNYTPVFALDAASQWRVDPDQERDKEAERDEV